MSNLQAPNAPVNLWYTRCGAATASALAIANQWLQAEFSKGGTLLHSLRDSESLETRHSHYHHKQSGMFREGGNIPPIWAKGNGQDTVVVGITWIDEYQGILTKSDSNILNIADLKGKRIGIPRRQDAVIDFQRGAAQHGFSTAFSLFGLKKEDATWVDIDAPSYELRGSPRTINHYRHAEVEALNSGVVDAIFVRFVRGYQLSKLPEYRQLINLNDHPDPLVRVNNGTPRPITVDRAFLEKHPDIVTRYLAVLLKTADWASKHPDEVIRIIANENQNISGVDIVASHGSYFHVSFTPKLTALYLEGLEAQKNFLRDWGYVKNDFDIKDWVLTEPLEQAQKLAASQPDFKQFLNTKAA